MGYLDSLNITGSALTAERFRTDIILQNLANQNTTRTAEGGPYRRKQVESQNPLVPLYDPDHPDANEDGYVMIPNVNSAEEMVDLMAATRAYEANVTALNIAKSMALKALEIGK